MPAESTASLRPKIGFFLGLLLFGAMLLSPTPEGMKPEAQRVAAVALLMATWWISEATSIAVTSLLPLALFPLLEILPADRVAPYYTDEVIFLFFGGFIVALAIQKWNLHRRIALHTIRRVGAKPTRLVLGFMLATAFLSMWMSNTACAMMMFPIGMAVVVQLAQSGDGEAAIDPKVTAGFGSVLMLSIAYASSLGGVATLIGSPTNIVFAGAVRRLFPQAPEVGFLQWMAVGLPIVLIYLPITWFYLCRYSGQEPLHTVRYQHSDSVIEDELRKMGRMTFPEKQVLVIWAVLALLWIFRSPIDLGGMKIPGWSQLFPKPAFFRDSTVAMAMGIVLCLMPTRTGEGSKVRERLMDWETIRQGVPWGVLFLFGGGFAMAAGVEQTGLGNWIGGLLAGLSSVSPLVMMAMVTLVMAAITEVTSNTATAVMGMPILAATAVKLGIHPFFLMIPGTVASSLAFMLPVSTPPNAIVFGSGWITIPQMARAGIVLDILGVIVVTFVVYALGGAVFGIHATQMPSWATMGTP